MPLVWVICWLNNIRPDKRSETWQLFEVSHRCCSKYRDDEAIGSDIEEPPIRRLAEVGMECIDPSCLIWEPKNINQERGGRVCRLACLIEHEDCLGYICACNDAHIPHCI